MKKTSSLAWCAALIAGLLLAPELAAQPPAGSDAELETFLLEGKVLRKRKALVGITRPVRVEVEWQGRKMAAVFKSVDENRRGKGFTTFNTGSPELNFTDSYRYEPAAYLLDRELGLNMVPVAVIRRVDGDKGALLAWIPDALHENRLEPPPGAVAVAKLAPQKALMRLFDALILNTDRRIENWLVRSEDWRLFLIDHSRAFRESEELPDEFLASRARLPREVYQRLTELDGARLDALVGELLSDSQITALLSRRDRIVEKIDRDCEQYGEEAIFSGS